MMKIEGVRAPPTDLLKSLVSVSQATQVSNATAFKPSPATLAMATPRATQVRLMQDLRHTNVSRRHT